MSAAKPEIVSSEERVLVLAPTGQDARLICDVLGREGIAAESISGKAAFCAEGSGTASPFGVFVVAEEALDRALLARLNAFVTAQEPWSDLPIVVMTTGGETTLASLRISKELRPAGNVALLERPFRPITLISTVQVGLRSRRRQYEVRELLRKQLEATRVRDEFISVASHELKTPLTSLKLQMQISQRRRRGGTLDTDPSQLEKFVDGTSRQIERLVRLVEDMLDVSRINTGKLKLEKSDVDLSALVLELTERLSQQLELAGCKLELDLEPSVVGHWDRYRMEQVFLNLLTNAIRYAPGKPVSVSVRRAPAGARLVVRDQGKGVAPENHEMIFRRFERAVSARNIDGLGLGLYICRQIVEDHGGKIHVESDGSSGAAFIVEMPLKQAPLSVSEPAALAVNAN